jgi:hypothetical protein
VVTTYVDSSALVAIYVPERFSNAARQTVRTVPQLPFTQLHELEVPNALELLVGRGSIRFLETSKNPRGGGAGAPMPPYTLSHEDAVAVAAYLKSLP